MVIFLCLSIADSHFNFYGEVWQLFEQVLLEMDCPYWWALYKSIFENNFAMDKEALRLRIQIAKKRIHKKGAAAVGHYLEELEKKGKSESV